MSNESVCQVSRSCVDVSSFLTRLMVRFMIFYSVSPEYFGHTLVIRQANFLHREASEDPIVSLKLVVKTKIPDPFGYRSPVFQSLDSNFIVRSLSASL
jgi:hypothetical protein